MKLEDFNYLHKIVQLCPDNEFINYIVDRVAQDKYRGIQCSQHNRLTFEYFESLLKVIYEIAGDSVFCIHVGDDNGKRQPLANIYYKIVDETNKISGKGTVNSIKKNTFPDIARMGFLNRYDKNNILINEALSLKRYSVYSVGLSQMGIQYVNADPFTKIKLFTSGVEKLTKNTASELVELMYFNDYGIDCIDILEYMYIFSDDRCDISFNDKLRYLIAYRQLPEELRQKVTFYLRQFCNPNNRKSKKNKTLLRDYNNWKNESQQIFSLLGHSTYFKVENNKIILNTGNYGLFDPNAKRGEKSKKDYFTNHCVKRNKGYELHHIVPFSMAKSKNDALYIDDFKNLIYLKSQKHAEFTKSCNKNVILKYSDNKNIIFLDFDDSFIMVDLLTDALFSPKLLPIVKEYNNKLLKKFYYTDFK